MTTTLQRVNSFFALFLGVFVMGCGASVSIATSVTDDASVDASHDDAAVVMDAGVTSGDGAVFANDGEVPNVAQTAYLKAWGDDTGSDVLGSFGVVAISADGNTLAIGSPGDRFATTGVSPGSSFLSSIEGSGAVYVFKRTGSTWNEDVFIKPESTSENLHFGSVIALSPDGNSLAVGATTYGFALYSRGETTWAFATSQHTNDSTVPSAFAFSNDGSRLVVGEASVSASVWSFEHGTVQLLTDLNLYRTSHNAMRMLSLSADGRLLAYSGVDSDAPAHGTVTICELDASSGACPPAMVVPAGRGPGGFNPPAGIGYGSAISLGGTYAHPVLAVGAPLDASSARGIDGNPNSGFSISTGAVFVYDWPDGLSGRDVQSYLKASNADPTDLFGSFVALSADGTTLAVGAPGEGSAARGINGDQNDNANSLSGAAYVFTVGGALR